MNAEVLSISDLSRCIRGVIEAEDLFRDVWVRGEISNYVSHSSGHRYFSLKDDSALIRAVMWRDSARTVKFQLADGMSIIARGRVTVYEKQGQYQFVVSEVVPDGTGTLYLAYEQLKEKLQKEGLFDASKNKPIPGFPRKLGIITSPTAAALKDMISVAQRRMPSIDIILIPTLMQGDGAEASVLRSLVIADSRPDIDVIVLSRGGGSIEDLWTFNSESVVRAIHAVRKPTVCAIGHETDFTLSEFAADLRAPTPSAAMELIVPDCVELKSRIAVMTRAMISSLDTSIAQRRTVLDMLMQSPGMKYPERIVQERFQSLDTLTDRLRGSYETLLVCNEKRLCEATGKLQSLSPLAVLARGYSVVKRDSDGAIVRRVDDVVAGDVTETLVSDGTIISEVLGSRR